VKKGHKTVRQAAEGLTYLCAFGIVDIDRAEKIIKHYASEGNQMGYPIVERTEGKNNA
jgi:hypothetical protein